MENSIPISWNKNEAHAIGLSTDLRKLDEKVRETPNQFGRVVKGNKEIRSETSSVSGPLLSGDYQTVPKETSTDGEEECKYGSCERGLA